MNIEEYARRHPHSNSSSISPLLVALLEREHPKVLLDVGSGDGSLLTSLIHSGYLENCQILAVDLSKTRVARLRARLPRVMARVDNAEKLKTVPARSVDFVLSTQVIEHVDDAKMLRSISRVLRPQGTAYITTVYKKWYAWYFYRAQCGWALDPTHVREYSGRSQLLNLSSQDFDLLLDSMRSLKYKLAPLILRVIPSRRHDITMPKLPGPLENMAIPIPGYYLWELALQKKSRNINNTKA